MIGHWEGHDQQRPEWTRRRGEQLDNAPVCLARIEEKTVSFVSDIPFE